jgi:hypothetical protein
MNILYKSKLTKFMGSTMGGDVVGQARDQIGSKGGRSAQTHGRPSLNYGGSRANLAGTLPMTRGGVCRLN